MPKKQTISERIDDLERRVKNNEDILASTNRAVIAVRDAVAQQDTKMKRILENMGDYQTFLQDHATMMLGEFHRMQLDVNQLVRSLPCRPINMDQAKEKQDADDEG